MDKDTSFLDQAVKQIATPACKWALAEYTRVLTRLQQICS